MSSTLHPKTEHAVVAVGLEDDPDGARIVSEELRLLDVVSRTLRATSAVDASAARGRVMDDQRLLELRDEIAVAKPEDLPSLFEQMHHVGALRAHRGLSVQGSADPACPYFGHMRLEEQLPKSGGAAGFVSERDKLEAHRRDILVGSRSYVDSGEGLRIVDWRNAPVSRLYYRYAEGDDYEEELGNRIVEGRVVVRRGVGIVAGQLVRVAAPQGTFIRGKDGRWHRSLSGHSKLETETPWSARHGVAAVAKMGVEVDGRLRQDKHLPAIASMLDEQQFNLIAKESAGLIAIQGSAGSGKTTVGLHRIAVLAFREPQRFRPEKILVVVPNDALIHYVARVLPSLGVDGVRVTTFARFAKQFVAQMFPRLPAKMSDETPPVVSRMKEHAALLRGIERVVARKRDEVDARIRTGLARWPGSETALVAWSKAVTDGNIPPDARVSIFGQWLAGKRQLPGVAVAALPSTTRSAIDQLLADARSETRSVSSVWDEVLTSRGLLEEIFAAGAGTDTMSPAQLDQAHAWCVRQTRIRADGERDGEQPSLDAGDFALLLRCWQELRGPLVDSDGKPVTFAHLFVDEVQDASPTELRVLLDLTGRERCVTLAGDVAQRLLADGDDRGEFDWDALLGSLGVAHKTIEPLCVSYRSTAEITRFARSILGTLAHDQTPELTRHGPPVELFGFASAGEATAWLAEVLRELASDEPDANVALIARFPQQADVYFEGLSRAEVPNVRRVTKQDFSWEPGVDVTDVRQTKGLEFDEVVLLETTAASYPKVPAARHALYVGATRASHQLWCVASEAPSALVTAAIDDLGDADPASAVPTTSHNAP